MRTVIFMRHAEAAHPAPGGSDKSRPLTPLGRKQAASCAGHLFEAGLVPDVILHSPAARILETRDAMLAAWNSRPVLIEDAAIYSIPAAAGDDLVGHFTTLMAQADDAAATLLVLGHNPHIAHLVTALNYNLPPDALGMNFAPATACAFATSADSWHEVSPANSRLDLIVLAGERSLRV